MSLVVYNTLSRSKEAFVPVTEGRVGIYTCGPTVYRYAHIGNLRAYLFADIIRRILSVSGYDVQHVMNVTDVGHLASDADEGPDKVLQAAREQRKTPLEIARFYEQAFFVDTERLNILRPHVVCRATDHIAEMIELVERLLELGYAYEIEDGIYFNVSRFFGYGQLSRTNLDDQLAGARVDVNVHKRHPADFALWKQAGPEHSMWWDSPWGKGYPGWHIECSAMAMKYLGDRIDIHTGGIDHVPIHHENEVAQADACVGRRVVNYWLHGEFLVLSDEKMSKSTGNIILLEDLIKRGYSPLAFRYLCLLSHYRKRANFTWQALDAAASGLQHLQQLVGGLGDDVGKVPDHVSKPFMAAIQDDFNVPRALALLWDTVRNPDIPAEDRKAFALFVDQVCGLNLDQVQQLTGSILRTELCGDQLPGVDGLTEQQVAMIAEREQARLQKDWQRADSIRDDLAGQGVRLEDGPQAITWVKE